MQHIQRDIQRCPRVAVYGTLKQGQHNHYWLDGAPLLGTDRLTAITLYDLGPYPGAKAESSAGTVVEIYAINAEQLALLDQLEGYLPHALGQELYNRAIFNTQHGKAWCYIYNSEVDEKTQLDW
ncbi:gamma-glutamylcyclotransferase family protein [Vreelandella piezotolerans]|uniref:Gamma-glutamylcyclotransferase n=1 Tax=Vreelandella piezotolerans TaxID=2609667 RepID=A0ABQ6X7J3_9GAMM|nr:gamma-glutamylcyclotransferase family protein [Halomonas piezotolerans]KAE8437993.1 gamma-glutamylcyclotransferase [Halomonas piezotolerans]QJA23020.1 gamma-glutamylcyclotransferase [Halomonas piezotolerans]